MEIVIFVWKKHKFVQYFEHYVKKKRKEKCVCLLNIKLEYTYIYMYT